MQFYTQQQQYLGVAGSCCKPYSVSLLPFHCVIERCSIPFRSISITLVMSKGFGLAL